MESMGIFEAKTHFSEIIEGVERGGEYVITRHGKPVAKIVGTQASDAKIIQQTVDALFEFRKERKGSQKEISAWIREGRRF